MCYVVHESIMQYNKQHSRDIDFPQASFFYPSIYKDCMK